MVNEEHMKYMIKMAAYDKHDGKECKPMTQYSRRDYVSMQMLRSLLTGTAAFAILLGLWAVYRMEYLMEAITTMDVKAAVTACVMGYAAFLALYELITYIVAQKRYTAGRKKVKQYYGSVKKLNQIYKREDKIKMPTGGREKQRSAGTR